MSWHGSPAERFTSATLLQEKHDKRKQAKEDEKEHEVKKEYEANMEKNKDEQKMQKQKEEPKQEEQQMQTQEEEAKEVPVGPSHAEWVSLPLLSQADVRCLRAVSRSHVRLVDETLVDDSGTSDSGSYGQIDPKLVNVLYSGDVEVCMDDFFDMLLPYGPVMPVDWATTPDGQELVTVSFSNPDDAAKACEVRVKEIRNERGSRITCSVFRCLQ